MTDPWPLRSSLELGALSTAVPCACLHVKHVLWEWGLNSLAESAELLVSELVSNAVSATGQPGQTVTLSLAGNATRVLIEVRDSDPRPPQTKATNDDGASKGTDGVLLVAALSTRWNWYLTEEPPGKVVWCELVLGHIGPPTQPQPTQPQPTQPQPTQPPTLPRRVPRARQKPQAEIVTDLDILRRLRDHLMS
jgi:anti-sigma regulatory factor (Ser/Thr protein kinase)